MARPRPAARRVLAVCLLTLVLTAIAPSADTTVQPVPFAQDWSNADLITINDDWSGVPGIVGYRGDGLASTTSVDPQTVLGEGTPVVDVNANQASPNTFTTGGVAEFTAAGAGGNAVVALQGSGTARAPNLVFTVATTALSTIAVSYNLRDIDGSADNAVQPVALQYRAGTTGPYTNLPAGFVADATTGPGLATLVTPVSVTLPAAAADKPVVQIRVITTDAVGSDEWVGIDDITVTGSVVVEPTNPSGTGAASPNSVESGASVLLTVAVTRGENPVSTGLNVTADLNAIGGSTAQPLFDDATNGDGSAGDRTFSFRAMVDNATTPGSKSLPVTIHDEQGRTGSATISLAVATPVTTDVVISQLYGGGGNSGATYTHDFIELFNRGALPVNLRDWSLQYAAADRDNWMVDRLEGEIQPGRYFLVQQARGTGGTTSLPTPDHIGDLRMSGTAGKIALVGNTTELGGTCPSSAQIADFVGYGTSANCFEGSGPAPTLSNTTAAVRVDPGIDTNDNALDFRESAPTPHNVTGIPPSGVGRAMPAAVPSGGSTLLTVTVTPGAVPAALSVAVTADLSPIGGPGLQTFYDDGLTGGDITANDRIFSWTVSVAGGPGFRTIAATVSETLPKDQLRSATVAIRLAVEQTTTLPISTIQGSAATSTFDGQFVTTTGVVTAHRSNGFFIQTPDGEDDRNPLTSEGLFIFTGFGAPMPAAGDVVQVSGAVAEFAPGTIAFARPSTEISGGPAFVVTSTGQTLPAAIPLMPGDAPAGAGTDQLERFEGMRVRASLLVAGPTDGTKLESSATAVSNGDFTAVVLGVPRPAREPGIDPTQNVPEGTSSSVPRFDGNFERLRVDSDGRGGPRLEVVGGQVIHDMTGVLDHAGTTYTFLPDPLPWVPSGNGSAVPVPAPTENEFTVASFNMERLFDDVDDDGDDDGDDVPMTPDGYQRRLRKASLAVRTVMLSPDIIGVEEVEHETTLQAVAARINADTVAAGGTDPQYVARLFEGNDPGGIDVGFLIKTSRVAIVSLTQVGKETTYVLPGSSGTALLNDRPPLVLEAMVHGPLDATLPVTVIVNHLRSLLGIDDPADGARVRDKRRRQAEFLAGYIQSRQAANPAERIISVGDYNAFQFSDGFVDVMGAIEGTPSPAAEVVLPAGAAGVPDPPLEDLVNMLNPANRYSFVFGGNTQVLDHVLVNGRARARVSRFQYARNNADFPESLRGDDTRPERLSDHDMPVGYFVFFGAPVVTLLGDATMTVEACQSFEDPGATAFDDTLGTLVVNVSGRIDTNVPEIYTLEYTASNGAFTTTVTRTIHVVDTTRPVLTLNGLAAVTIEAGSAWTDPGATASDTCTNLTGAIQVTGRVNRHVPGVYVLTYSVSDGFNPSVWTQRTVTVVDTLEPWMSPLIALPSSINASPRRMVDVLVLYLSLDVTGLPACSLGVTSNQPSVPNVDWQVLSPYHVRVRAERTGGRDRVYTVTATCSDTSGNRTSRSDTVTVRK